MLDQTRILPFLPLPIGRQLQVVAKLLTSRTPVPVLKVSHGSFDTHSNQRNTHDRLLHELAEALVAFRQAMQTAHLWQQVVLMTYAEFGRRAAENGSTGTDHGTAAPHFLLGGKVLGGLYGQQPALTDLVEGDLRHVVDYRSLYMTVARRWWGITGDFYRGGTSWCWIVWRNQACRVQWAVPPNEEERLCRRLLLKFKIEERQFPCLKQLSKGKQPTWIWALQRRVSACKHSSSSMACTLEEADTNGVTIDPLERVEWEGEAEMLRRLEMEKAVLVTVRICA